MGTIANRRILWASPSDGSDCLYDGVACTGTSSHPPAPSQDLFLAAGCLIAAAFFLALTFYILCRHYNRRREHDALPGSLRNNGQRADRQPKTTGLDEDTIEAIAVCEYNAEDGLLGATECSVCLSDFEDGELIRLLPKCGHAFHVSCIDAWLQNHVNCPLCRASIVSPALPADPTTPPPPPSLPITPSVPLERGSEEAAIDPSAASSNSNLPRLVTVRRSASMVVIPVVGGSGQSSDEAGESSAGEEMNNGRINPNGANKDQVGSLLVRRTGRRFFFYKHRRARSLVLPL